MSAITLVVDASVMLGPGCNGVGPFLNSSPNNRRILIKNLCYQSLKSKRMRMRSRE